MLEYFEDHHVELYNLKNDPGKMNDLSEKLPEKSQEMIEVLQNWREEVNAQLPAANLDFEEKKY